MTIEQENAIKVVQDLIDRRKIDGEQATVLIIGIIKDDAQGSIYTFPNINQGTPSRTELDYKPIKVYYDSNIAEKYPNYTFNTTKTNGVNEMINTVSDAINKTVEDKLIT